MRKLGAVAALLVLLSACGQKGPLYLPDAEGTVITRPTQTATPQPNPQTPNQTPKQEAPPADTEKNQDKPR